MTSRAVVFLGPTLAVSEARDILEVTYLPPAREADLISAVTTYRPRVIGLVDGAFGQSLSVWHKEILFALESGVHVYGSSSIGALRAAETSEFGMIGVGEVYRMYASGELEDDDEVAIAHADAEEGYRTLSAPMVNLRSTFARGREMGICDKATCDAVLALAKAIYYPERTIPRIIEAALDSGVPADVAASLRRLLENDYVDIKRHDAIILLQTIRDLPPELPPFAANFRLERPRYFNALYERERSVERSNVRMSLHAIADYAALHMADFGDLNFHALNRAVAVEMAEVLGIQVPPERIESEAVHFRAHHALKDEAMFQTWLAQNDLTTEEWWALIREVAVCRHLHGWLMLRRGTGNTRAFLDELRLAGKYNTVSEAAAAYEQILQSLAPDDVLATSGELDIEAQVIDHLRHTGASIGPDVADWAEQAGFDSLADLQVELLRARLARQRLARAAQALMSMETGTHEAANSAAS